MIMRKYVIVELPEGSQGTVAEAISALQKQEGTAWRTCNAGSDLKEVRAPLFRFFDELELSPE